MKQELLTPRQEFSDNENGPFGSVDRLLADEDLNGDDIANYFTGALLRHGSFETSKGGNQQIDDILRTLSAVAKLESVNEREEPNPYAQDVAKSVTRSDGLRESVIQLGQDERVQEVALADLRSDSQNGLARRLALSREDYRPILANVEQISGYLFGDADKNEVNYQNDEWVHKLSDKIKFYIEGKDEWIDRGDAAWRDVIGNAEAAKIDLRMLKNSADLIKNNRRRNGELGRVSLGNMAREDEVDYDDLLIESPYPPEN